ncbi:hypothetical protein KAR91_39475, partial [Candidatus Pacearchaeota archaeon]|nr:hypothetical protein [Candidatus Pacearchaeota archaeon]
ARLFIEVEYEEQLQHGSVIGAIFALKNMGWADKQTHDHTLNVTGFDICRVSPDEINAKES